MLLALDTSTRYISIALHDGDELAAESSWRTAGHHTVELAPYTALMLQRAGCEPARLRAVAVAIGPGSYTGLRIGLALAKGLALAHHLPLLGVPTFDVLMRAQPPRPERTLALLPAGRGRVLAAAYLWSAGRALWEAQGGFRLLEWSALEFEFDLDTPTCFCGEIDAAGREALRRLKARASLAAPAVCLRRAGFLAEIGWERLRRGEADDPQVLAPIYGGRPEGMAA